MQFGRSRTGCQSFPCYFSNISSCYCVLVKLIFTQCYSGIAATIIHKCILLPCLACEEKRSPIRARTCIETYTYAFNTLYAWHRHLWVQAPVGYRFLADARSNHIRTGSQQNPFVEPFSEITCSLSVSSFVRRYRTHSGRGTVRIRRVLRRAIWSFASGQPRFGRFLQLLDPSRTSVQQVQIFVLLVPPSSSISQSTSTLLRLPPRSRLQLNIPVQAKARFPVRLL